MAAINTYIKAPRIVNTMVGVLARDLTVPQLVWRDAFGDFAGALDDTISLRVPAYATAARTRALRAGSDSPIVVDKLEETKVDVTLDTDIYKAHGVTLGELTLDVSNFEQQIAVPTASSVARGVEDALVAEMNGATYNTDLALDEADPWKTLVKARLALDKANVPREGRSLVVGSDVEEAILVSDRLSKFDQSGSDTALRENTIGRLAGFTVVSVPGLDPDVAIAFHRTAFVLTMRAPQVPQGAVTGASRSYQGIAMTAIQDYDFINTTDRFAAHVYVGTEIVQDHGTFDADGRFVPASTDDAGTADLKFVRAVRMSLDES